MSKKKVLFICGSLNQTTMMHQISAYLHDYNCYFTSYYGDSWINYLVGKGYGKFSILNGPFRWRTEEYLKENNLAMDYRGVAHNYDLVITCADLIIPKNIRKKKIILVQEGMTDPENFMFYLVKYLKLYRWLASTSTMGMSNQYTLFCVASEGYKKFFIRKGAQEEKIIVTGIPNFDNVKKYLNNNFPHKDFVLVCTTDMRETYKYENRKKFILRCLRIVGDRQLIFKLHPNENVERATNEINKYAPSALVYHNANTNEMIANCSVLITKYSSVAFIGLALNKEVHSSFDIEELKQLLPIQNNGASAERIALIAKHLIETNALDLKRIKQEFEIKN